MSSTKVSNDCITSLEGSKLTGNVSAAMLTGTLPALDATNITNLPAANLTGTLPALNVGGTLNGQDNTLSNVNLKDCGEVANAIGSTGGGTQDIDLTLGNVVSATVDSSTNTFTFSNPTAAGNSCSFTLILTNGGSQTVNWPASVDWPAATAPELTAAGTDVLVFFTVDAGTTWHGMAASTGSA